MATHEDILTKLGYEANAGAQAAKQADADDPATGDGSLSHNGKYEVLGFWSKGDVEVHLERNTAPEDVGDGMSAVVTHPPLLVVEKAGARLVAVSPRDPEALEAVLTDLE